MGSTLQKKIERYSGLIKEVANWPEFLFFKTKNGASDKSFTFKLRNSNSITVPKATLPPFKEIFFDRVYLKYIPGEYLRKDSPVIVDIGANVGYFSLFMLFNFPKAKVYAYEPIPFNFNKLAQHTKTYKKFQLHPFNKAVSHNTDKLQLNFASEADAYSTMASIHADERKCNQIEVDTTTLELILKENDLQQIDFLKMDCEGSEYNILYGTPPAILRKIKAMTIETHDGVGPKENLPALAKHLQAHGFQLKSVQQDRAGYIWAWQPVR